MTGTNEREISLSQLTNFVCGVPDVPTFINGRPGNVFKRLETGCEKSIGTFSRKMI